MSRSCHYSLYVRRGDAAFHVVVDVADAVGEVFALGDEKSYKFGRVGAAHAEFGELLLFVEAEFFQFGYVVDFAHGAYCEAAEMRVDHDRLRVSVADDTNANIAQHFIDILTEFCAEI